MSRANTVTRIISLFLCTVMLLLIFAPLSVVDVKAKDTDGSGIMVSMGDSYSSGEGIEKFYGQDDHVSIKVKNPDWLAHRSEKSWPGRLKLNGIKMSEKRNSNWYFVAASGAETYHMNNSQYKDYDISGYVDDDYLEPQLKIFETLRREGKEAEYVTITIGGNDADFVGTVSEASLKGLITPGSLNDKLQATWNEFYYGVDGEASIRERIEQAYKDIESAAGKQAKIIVAGYPTLLEQNGKGWLFTKDAAKLINDSVVRFNDEIESIVKSCKAQGMKICFVSVEEKFAGHEAYSDTPYIRKVDIFRNDEDLKGGISSYSMHPNEEGAKKYAECVQAKIDQIEADGGKSEWPTMTSSDEREIALVLDVSGSMSGTPLQETIEASEKFVKTILKEDASIGVVTYDSDSMCIADFCMNESYLTNAIKNINSGGGTDMDAGLTQAYSMLKDSDAKKKIIVLMSDGEPNEGRVGDELIEYAQSIKDEGIYIYTLGFFSSLYDKASAQSLLQSMASDGCHFEVDYAENLRFVFEDVADQLNGQKYIYVRIACPVDVTVEYDGEELSSKGAEGSQRTEFGTLTFEENEKNPDSKNDNRIKVLRLKDGVEYDIQIEGNGRGTMDYTIGFMDESGEYSDMRKFKNIKISKKTVIDTVAENSSSTVLNVDEDGDGKYDLKYKASANSRGEIVDYTYLIYIAIAVVVLIAVLVVVIKIKKRLKNKKGA